MDIINDATFQLIGIAALCGLIFISAARSLGQFAFLLSLLLIGGGYMAVLADAFFGINALAWAVGLTALGMIIGRWSAERDIPTVEWRARGLHSTIMAATFTALAFVTFITSPATPGDSYPLIAVAYGVLAAWNWLAAVHMAWLVLTDHDGKSVNYGYGSGYRPNDDYGQND